MSVRRIRDMLSRGESVEATELGHEVVSMLDSLGSRLRDLQSVLSAADLGPHATTVELLVRGLADDFGLSADAGELVRVRQSDTLSPWRELAGAPVDGSSELPEWCLPAFRQVTSILRGEGFPCLFARQANKLETGWVCFVDGLDTDAQREHVRTAILSYYGILRRSPREKTTMMPLLVVVKPVYPMLTRQQYFTQAWSLFQYLHDHDSEPWPLEVPTDPERGDWSFCFGGLQLFSNVSCPAHKLHKSRNLGDSLVFAMQPRTNFDLVGGNTKKGRAVRAEIRARAERYEGRPAASHLGFYGTPENREWMQMATPEFEDEPDYPKRCPFRFKGEK